MSVAYSADVETETNEMCISMAIWLEMFMSDQTLLCRPGVPGAPLPARAILSMGGLSHGVIRVNTEDKNSALTVQDVGHVMPGGEDRREDKVQIFRPKTYNILSLRQNISGFCQTI